MKRRKFIRNSGATAAAGLAGAWSHATAAPKSTGALSLPTFFDPSEGLKKRGGWSLAVIPDTQNYAKFAKNQENFDLMTEWLRENSESWKIQAVLHEGDFVEQNDIETGGGRGFGDQNSDSQWMSARRAMERLNGIVPTIYATGNHDYGTRNAENRRTQFNSYFGLTDNHLTNDGRGGGIWLESAPNSYGAKTLENTAYEIKGPDGRDLLIVSLEWGPRREAVEWAKGIFEAEVYKNHTGLLLTHAFLTPDNLRDSKNDRPGNPHNYPLGELGNTHDGEELWQALVQPSQQIELVLSGHEMGRHVGYRKDPGAGGQSVHQMLFNAQGMGGGSRKEGNGGDGWLRLLTFEPDGKTMTARTFSPLFLKQGKAPWFRDPAWSFQIGLSPI
jgi:hypothetical protein